MLSPLKACLGRTRINASVELSKARLFLEPAELDADRNLAGCLDGSVLRLAPQNTNTDSVFVTKKLGTNSEDGANCPDSTDSSIKFSKAIANSSVFCNVQSVTAPRDTFPNNACSSWSGQEQTANRLS